jgi:small GTP-binding protein
MLAGSEKFRGIVKSHFSQASAALVVFDITNRKSFEECKYWINELKNNCRVDPRILLVGNKLDLVADMPEKRTVSTEEADSFARKGGYIYMETSALTHKNVKQAFDKLLTGVLIRDFNGGE